MKINVKTVRDFIDGKMTQEEADDYLFAIQCSKEFSKSEDVYSIGSLFELSFGLIKDIEDIIEHNEYNDIHKQIEVMQVILNEKKIHTSVYSMDILSFTKFNNYIKDSITQILDTERKLLENTSTDADVERALKDINGESLFKDISVYMQLRTLADGDVTKIDAVRKCKYSTCLTELVARNRIQKFEDNYRRIKKNNT